MFEYAHNTNRVETESQGFLWLAVAVLGIGFFLADQDLMRSERETSSVSEMQSAMSNGNFMRQLGYSMIGLMGLFFMTQPARHRFRFDRVSGHLILLFIIWCLFSIFWTSDFGATSRRLVVMVMCGVGALGFIRQFGPRDCATIAIGVFTAWLGIGIAAEVALGNFHPFDTGYRFSGTVHPNTQGCFCACACLAAVCAASAPSCPHRRRLILLAFIQFVFLWLTKSRTCVAALGLGLMVFFTFKRNNRKVLATWVFVAWVLCACGLLAYLSGFDVTGTATDTALMGRNEQTGSLSGRVPLWAELTPYIEQRPFAGWGYKSFWNGEHIHAISKPLEWTIFTAHSSYLDLVLSVGLVGAGALLLALIGGLVNAAHRYRSTSNVGDGFVLSLLVFAVFHGFMESGFVSPILPTFLAACALMRVAYCEQTALAEVEQPANSKPIHDPRLNAGGTQFVTS